MSSSDTKTNGAVELNVRLSGAQRYRQVCQKVRIRANRELRAFMRGKRDYLECTGDDQRRSIIAEFDRLRAAILAATGGQP